MQGWDDESGHLLRELPLGEAALIIIALRTIEGGRARGVPNP
jgi:hypothetical protein